MLVQEAAHEEANIIFGAVVDDRLPEGELRVTVIATGLAGSPDRRASEPRRAAPQTHEAGKVHPLRPQSAEGSGAPPAATAGSADDGVPLLDASHTEGLSGEFASPFEDELDVPAFLRKRGDGANPQAPDGPAEDDTETPAFFRRALD